MTDHPSALVLECAARLSSEFDKSRFGYTRSFRDVSNDVQVVLSALAAARAAPDALRVAVEALRGVSALRSNGHGDEWESGFTQATVRAADIADQALAALQAEQGAK